MSCVNSDRPGGYPQPFKSSKNRAGALNPERRPQPDPLEQIWDTSQVLKLVRTCPLKYVDPVIQSVASILVEIISGTAKPLKHCSRTRLSLGKWKMIEGISACSKFLLWTVTDKYPTLQLTSYLCADEPIAGSVRGVPSKMRKLALCECRQMGRLLVTLVTPNYTLFTAGTTDQFSRANSQVSYVQCMRPSWRLCCDMAGVFQFQCE